MRGAIYARVSTEEQAKEGYSINAQINSLNAYAKLYGFDIVKIYKDEGLSGKDIKRPALNQMMQDAKHDTFDVLLVWKISRLSRNLKNLLNIVDILENLGVSFISQSETFNTATPVGKMTLQMLGSIAEFERNTIVENIRLGLEEKARRGEWLGGRVFGYISIDKKLEIDDREAEIIKEIFKLFNEGLSVYKITYTLRQKGYKTINDKEFSQTAVNRILTNPIYAGFLRHYSKSKNSYTVKGIHPPIISEKLFVETQKKINPKPIKEKDSEFVLTGIIKCPICNCNLVRYKTSAYRYYRCGNYHNYGKQVCKGFRINADYIEKTVCEQINYVLKKASVIQYIYDILKIDQVFQNNFAENFKGLEYRKQKDVLNLLIEEICVDEEKSIREIRFKENYF